MSSPQLWWGRRQLWWGAGNSGGAQATLVGAQATAARAELSTYPFAIHIPIAGLVRSTCSHDAAGVPRPLPPVLVALAIEQRGALLAVQIAEVLGAKQIRRLTGDDTVTKLWHSAYALPHHAAAAACRVEAAGLSLDRPVVACLQTAAELYGFDLETDPRTHILADHDWSNATAGIVQHRYRPVRDHQLLDGQKVADIAETAVRMACRESDPARVLAVLDRSLFRTVLDQADLARVADDLRIRGISLTRELIGLADGRAESPGESWLRWVCHEAGFPPATPQIWITDDYGRRCRIDLGWEKLRVGCEYDGVEFHTGGALTRDRSRYNTLGRQQWLMHGVTHSMIWHQRRFLVADIRSLLDQRSA
ncbi:hypothetical protein ABIB25_001808 [Nakamurella sp. UYEF19]|uniref:hypothetical protein n=1 Tax=Nakamurella sp. UYEF19 TaxID=1756392 RepID=UPI00339B5172